MAEIPARYLVHEVQVKTFTGTGAYGAVHADPVTRACFVDEKRRLVRGSDGDEVVSEATLFARRAHLADFREHSLVTLPTGRVATVITVADRNDGGMGAWQHVEVTLT